MPIFVIASLEGKAIQKARKDEYSNCLVWSVWRAPSPATCFARGDLSHKGRGNAASTRSPEGRV